MFFIHWRLQGTKIFYHKQKYPTVYFFRTMVFTLPYAIITSIIKIMLHVYRNAIQHVVE